MPALRQESGGQGVFVYGTLMFPEVFRAVTGINQPPPVAARLDNHRRLRVRHQCYPGAIPCRDSTIKGILLAPLPPHVLPRLDAFEGPEYERVPVVVHTATAPVRAWFYRMLKTLRTRLSTEDWQPEMFRQMALSQFAGQPQDAEFPNDES